MPSWANILYEKRPPETAARLARKHQQPAQTGPSTREPGEAKPPAPPRASIGWVIEDRSGGAS
jgi:hypothetical protein